MADFATALWAWITTSGSTLAATLIVVIALGVNALTLLFAGSAVVALERFARVAKRPSSIAACALSWAGVLGAGAVYYQAAELAAAPASLKLLAWLQWSAGWAVVVGLLVLAQRALLPRVGSRTLGIACLGGLGLGVALLLGATGRVAFAASPLILSGAGGLLLWLRRRRVAESAVGGVESLCWTLVAALAVGVACALWLPGPAEAVARVGLALLALFGVLLVGGLVPLAAAGVLDTRLSAEWFIAVRYLLAKRRQTFISVISAICVLGIAAGVCLIVTVLSVMNGFERTWRDEIIGNRAHFTVHNGLGPIADYREVLERVLATEGVVAASPYLDAQGMVRGEAGEILGVRVRGVDPERVSQVTDLRDDLIAGSLTSLAEESEDAGDPAILIGSQLAGSLGVTVGDSLLLISPFGGPRTPLGPAPRLTRFTVAGVFESSFFQYDEVFTYVNLAAARDFRRVGDVVDGIEARTTDFYRSRPVGLAVQEALGFPYFTRDWKEFFPAFFQALKSERVMMFVLLTMIIVVAVFSIVSTLVMMIMEKSGDIAILKAMGAEEGSIERIFALEGALIGLSGTLIGVVAGICITARIAWIQGMIEGLIGIDTLPASVYQFSTLPAEFDVGQIALAAGISLVMSLGATLLPSRQAARLDPMESLRYE
ncbi:MAG: lipoprotein-releasing ABC transporter permease subunit [Myxococcota bacterium]